jgi:hypothetical protein
MINLAIPIPSMPGQQDIEIEMSMNGVKQKLHYRVEVIRWSECEVGLASEDRVACVRDLVQSYDTDWVIYHIGTPTEEYVPLTFIRKEDWAAQLRWLWEEV